MVIAESNLDPYWLDEESFKNILNSVPLVSIDICLVCNGALLLGKRVNNPLKGRWFTPGGRLVKNEPWQEGLIRIAKDEIALQIEIEKFRLMGVWDHIYQDSVFGPAHTTHYINLPFVGYLDQEPELHADLQHDCLRWFDLSEIVATHSFHEYIQSYAKWVMNDSPSRIN